MATLAGDIIVMNADTLTEIWRTHVPGGVGYFNSIKVANLNAGSGPHQDQVPELYVAGSLGIWRFTQSGEIP